MKYVAYLLICASLTGCATLTTIRSRHTIEARRECRNTPDVQIVAAWVLDETGIEADTCVRMQDVIVPVVAGHLAILLVDLDMPMADWWHLNDVLNTEQFAVMQLSWRDVAQLDNPYYAELLHAHLTTFPGGGWLDHPMSWDLWTSL